SPYFIGVGSSFNDWSFEDCLNLAKIENNVDTLAEIIITNNSGELFEKYANIDNINEVLVNEGLMSVAVNNFSSVGVTKDNNTNEISIFVNGNKLSFKEAPYIENGTTMVPMRAIFEALGAEVNYDNETKIISAKKDSTVILLASGSKGAFLNGEEKDLGVEVANKNGNTMVPLRFVSEALGAKVEWNGESRTVIIEDNKI
ncbi:MAG: stalk domain-containing protein, partial [Lachnospirales bacterium]